MKLSILVPVYNAEKFLPLCLDSILNQSFRDFEVILVNDGSTDRSLEILKTYAARDRRLKIFSRKNHGYGATLNFALKKAAGTFVAIVEPDDFIHRDMYKTLFSSLGKSNVEIVKCSFYNYYGRTGKTKVERVFHEVKSLSSSPSGPITLSPAMDPTIFFVDPTIWSCLYRREFLIKNHIAFLGTPGASFQDAGFQFKTFAVAKKVCCLEQPLYYYRRDNTNSSVKSSEKSLCVKDEFDAVDDFLAARSEPSLATIAAACRFRSYAWNLDRLPLKSALQFARVARKDYRRIKSTTAFRANFYRKNRAARALELSFATAHPTAYVFSRPLFRVANYLKHQIYVIISHI